METILKNITKLNDKVFAEKNRDILLSDYVQKIQPKVEVKDSYKNNGKIITMSCDYEMKYEVITELIEYFKLVNKRSGEESTKNNFGSFQVSKSVEIDFRGCKTEKQKEDKINKAVSEVETDFNNKFELALNSKIKNKNENFLNTFVDYNNNQFVAESITWLTNKDVYEEDFNGNEEFVKLNSEYAEVVEKINALKKIRTHLEDNLTAKKRVIALETLEKNKWEFEDGESDVNFKLPNPVINKVKEALSNAFVYKRGLFNY
ncbi:MAG: hypothetical protein IPJ01_10355 [Micavibrio sp.]|nr:hypothetical protein [Micavibrio sp.]